MRAFNHRWQQVAVHVRHERGRFSTHGAHLHPHKISGLERGAEYLLGKVRWIGDRAHQWAEAMLAARGIEGTRVLQGLLSLGQKHPHEALERACETALSYGAFRLRAIRQLLHRSAPPQTPLPFLEQHPIIRPLDDYARIVEQAIHRQSDRPSMGEGFLRHGSGVRGATDSPGPLTVDQGCDLRSTRPRSDYPSASCSSAELASVSPDDSSVITRSLFHQE